MLSRRQILKIGISAVALSFAGGTTAWAAGNAKIVERLNWEHGGVEKYKGTPEEAVPLLIRAAGFSAEVEAAFLAKTREAPYETRPLRDGENVGTMIFGSRPYKISRTTIAQPSKWPKTTTKMVDVWYVMVDGSQYLIMRPHVCGNWAIQKVFGPPEACPPCPPGQRACPPEQGDEDYVL